ncbi:MARVEL domain-containing protein 3 [Lampris incognitus]|uniref:MARVEL domain-containing protein 3 n=1 Tax=Lampris incognitus TaxID=2546036 RepID=UPI0024B53F19|nr:MARVEL domain-containing protein 3 [Lampris incognitus]
MPETGRHHRSPDMPETGRHHRSTDMPETGRHHNTDADAEPTGHREADAPHHTHPSSSDEEESMNDRDQRRVKGQERASGNARRGRQRPPSDRQRDVTPASHPNQPAPTSGRPGPSCTARERPASPPERRRHDAQHKAAPLYNLRYVLTARGLCQVMEVFVNLLIVICAGLPYSNAGGYRDLASLGGLYHYYYGGANAFTGADAARVKELDRLFHQLKRPPYVFAMACGGALLGYACLALALGVFRVPYRWPPVLLAEAALNLLIGPGYVPAVAFYFVKLKETYDHAVCQERERLYKSKGHRGFECQFHGTDIAGGLFGVLGAVAFVCGAVLAVRAFRSVRELKKRPWREEGRL